MPKMYTHFNKEIKIKWFRKRSTWCATWVTIRDFQIDRSWCQFGSASSNNCVTNLYQGML